MFWVTPSDPPKRLATGALSGGTGEDGGLFAILISAFVTPGGTIYGEPGGGVVFAMGVFLRFLNLGGLFFFEMRGERAGKIRSDLKNCNASWSF